MSWLLSPNGCRGRIRESLLHPLRRKSPPRAASLAKEQQPELANAANRNCNKKFQCSYTGNKPRTTANLRAASGMRTRPRRQELLPPLAGWAAAPTLAPSPIAPPGIYFLPSEQPGAWTIKPGNKLSRVVLNVTKSCSACSSVQWRAFTLPIHF